MYSFPWEVDNAVVAMVNTSHTIQLRNWSQTGFWYTFWYTTTAMLRISQLFNHTATSLLGVQCLKDIQIQQKFPLSVPGSLVLPETVSIDSLNDYISVLMTTDTLRTSQLFEDFATIYHKDCFEVDWFMNMHCPPCSKQDCLHFGPCLQSFRARRDISRMRPHSRLSSSCQTSLHIILRTTVMCATEGVEYPYHWSKMPVPPSV